MKHGTAFTGNKNGTEGKWEEIMNTTASHKIAWATFGANVIILLHHANLKNYYPDMAGTYADTIMDFFSVLSIPVMTYFFFISAFLFFRNFKMSEMKDKWMRRVRSLFIPYIIWNTFSVILQAAKGKMILENGILNFIRNNYIYINGTGCANGPLWYMFRLMEFVLLTPVIYYVIKNKNIVATTLVCIAISILNVIFGAGYFGFLYFLPVYVIGAYLGLNHNLSVEAWIAGEKSSGTKCYLKTMCCFIAVIVLGYITSCFADIDVLQFVFRYIAMVPFLMAVHYGTDLIPVKFISGGGMFLYCSHDIVYRLVRNLISYFHANMMISWLLLLIISGMIMVAAYCFLDKYMHRFLNLLTGGR